MCPELSAGTCAGGDSSDNWITKSRTLSEQRISVLQPNESDVQQIRDILNIILGEEGIEKTKFMTTTQHNDRSGQQSSQCHLPKKHSVLNKHGSEKIQGHSQVEQWTRSGHSKTEHTPGSANKPGAATLPTDAAKATHHRQSVPKEIHNYSSAPQEGLQTAAGESSKEKEPVRLQKTPVG